MVLEYAQLFAAAQLTWHHDHAHVGGCSKELEEALLFS